MIYVCILAFLYLYKTKTQEKVMENNRKMPVFKWRYIKNFFRFIYTSFRERFERVSFSVYQERLSICQSCPFLHYKERRCTDCGCWVDNKAKWKYEACPKEYWMEVE
jgi:hypothetical protein